MCSDAVTEAEFQRGNDWGKTVRVGQGMGVKVTKDDNAIFGTLRFAMFVKFNLRDCHSGKGVTNVWAEGLIFILSNVFPCTGGIYRSVLNLLFFRSSNILIYIACGVCKKYIANTDDNIEVKQNNTCYLIYFFYSKHLSTGKHHAIIYCMYTFHYSY